MHLCRKTWMSNLLQLKPAVCVDMCWPATNFGQAVRCKTWAYKPRLPAASSPTATPSKRQ